MIFLSRLASLFFILFIFLRTDVAVASGGKVKQAVNIYVYHLMPPFIVDKNKHSGLYYDFADYLNRLSSDYVFETIFVPRKRLDKMLKDRQLDGVLLGVSPIWFKDKNEQKYLWTHSFYHDRDEVISHASLPIEYEQPSSFSGKVFGGVRGFYYFGLNELVASGKIKRQDTIGERELLTMLAYKRIDAAIVSRSTFEYLTAAEFDKNSFHLSAKPHDVFERRILIPRQYSEIFNYLDPIMINLEADPRWQKVLAKYH